MDEIIKFAERRRDEEAEAGNYDNVVYWVGYIDGVKRAQTKCLELWQGFAEYIHRVDTTE